MSSLPVADASQPRPPRAARFAQSVLIALRLPYEYVAYYLLWLSIGLILLGWSGVAALLALVLPRPAAAPYGRRMVAFGFRLFLGMMRATGLFRFDLSALDALRDEPEGLVIAPNHPSLLDIVLVASRLPRVVCIAKAPVWDNPVLGGAVRLAGYIRNDGAPLSVVRRAGEELRAGAPLLVFPEGTRTHAGSADGIGPLKGGFALMARQAGAAVQTVFLEPDQPFLGKGWSPLRKPRLPMRFRARLGRRFVVRGPVDAFVAELEAYYRSELAPDLPRSTPPSPAPTPPWRLARG